MEVATGAVPEGVTYPPYPYRKVAFVDDQAEVAEFACLGSGSENVVYHGDLVTLLQEKHPELEEVFSRAVAGWLTESQDEAMLFLEPRAGPVSPEDVQRMGHALDDWGRASGIRRLTVIDTSRRQGPEGLAEDDWTIL
jgi:hypothetical protein